MPRTPARIDAQRLAGLYLALAHLALALAAAAVVADPRGVAGFYYHPRLVGAVHLVTLGWVTGSLLAVLYARGPRHAAARDGWGLGLFALGLAGMVSHFWIDEASGMAWSAGTLVAGLGLAAPTLAPAWTGGAVGRGPRLLLTLAFANLGLAAAVGLAQGIDKAWPFLPGRVLARVAAHAELAIVGWATLAAAGLAFALLPRRLPAPAPPGGALLWGTALVQAGTLTAAAALWLESRWVGPAALLAAAGGALLLRQLLDLLRHRPRELGQALDPAAAQALLALAYLVAAAVVGLALALVPPALWKLQAVTAYGGLAIVGFLAQLAAAAALPLAAAPRRARPRGRPSVGLRWAGFGLWFAGAPALIGGLTFERVATLRAGSALLLAAALAGAVELWRNARR